VIAGGGFGGLRAACALKSAPVDVTLIDRRKHHLADSLAANEAVGNRNGRALRRRRTIVEIDLS